MTEAPKDYEENGDYWPKKTWQSYREAIDEARIEGAFIGVLIGAVGGFLIGWTI